MGSLLSKLNGEKLGEAIDLALTNKAVGSPRQYIGGSSVANECDAYIALSMRGFPDNQIAPQLQRIFELGHILEDVLVAHIKASGYFEQLDEVDPKTGDQWEFKSHGGHHVSHYDGLAYDRVVKDWILFEAKSMNKAMFERFKNYGVRISHPMYFFQCQDYMQLSGLKYAILVSYCKDNSQIHAEYIELDIAEVGWLRSKIDKVVNGEATRIAYDSIEYRCKQCFKQEGCWGKKLPEVKCASCKFSKPDLKKDDGSWWCTVYESPADKVCTGYEVFEPTERE